MSVLTAAEGSGLAQMDDGLVQRYQQANQPPPVLLYVDRDCCSTAVPAMLSTWNNLQVSFFYAYISSFI